MKGFTLRELILGSKSFPLKWYPKVLSKSWMTVAMCGTITVQECMGMPNSRPDCIYSGLKYIRWECFQSRVEADS